MGLPRSSYYDAPSVAVDDTEIVGRIRSICEEFETYGYRRVGAALRHQGVVITAALLVFVDTMKELPMTLILRPFNFDTLATFVFQYASDELLEESALGALTIVVAGVVPIVLMSRAITRSRAGHRNFP